MVRSAAYLYNYKCMPCSCLYKNFTTHESSHNTLKPGCVFVCEETPYWGQMLAMFLTSLLVFMAAVHKISNEQVIIFFCLPKLYFTCSTSDLIDLFFYELRKLPYGAAILLPFFYLPSVSWQWCGGTWSGRFLSIAGVWRGCERQDLTTGVTGQRCL